MYQGDYAPASTVVFNFNTASFSDGSPITLAGTPTLSVYKNSTTESTTGVTLTVDFDARTGMHHVVIDTSADGTFYAAGNDFDVIITAGTVGGTSVVGRKVGSFSLNNRSALRPATAGRTLVVDAAGLADANMVKAGPTGSGTAQTAGDIYGAVNTRLPAALGANGNIKADVRDYNGTAGTFSGGKPAVLDSSGASFTYTTPPTAAANATAVWTDLLAGSDFSTVGSAGKLLKDDLDAAISTRMATFTLPTNFSALGISVGGHISNVDTLTTYTGDTPQTGDAFARLGAPAGASVSADIAAVKTDTGNLVSRITATLFSGITSLANWLRNMARKGNPDATATSEINANNGAGIGTFDPTTDSEEATRDRGDVAWITGAGGGGSSSGANSLVVTVNDGASPLQGAHVRFTLNATTWIQDTDANGQTTFNLDNGTWTVSISLAGYSFNQTTLAVSASGSQTYSMSQVSITPSSPGLTTGYLTAYDSSGIAEAGVEITCTPARADSSVTGVSLDGATRTAISDNTGLVQFTNLFKDVTYNFRRGASGPVVSVLIPTTAGATYALPPIIGQA